MFIMGQRWLGALLVILPLAAAAQQPGDPVQRVRLPNDVDYWQGAGFVEMVPPVRLPTDKVGDNAIQVWVKLPAQGQITGAWQEPQHRFSLELPPGTIADRVEIYRGEVKALQVVRGIEDVRGATIDSQGRSRFHVYQPVPGGDPSWLEGYEWPRTDNDGDRIAGERLVELYYPGGGAKAQSEMQLFRRLNQCGACHQPNRPVPLVPARPLLPETDSHGFYQPLTVLEDAMPVRTHRKWDLNADDPFVSVWCATQRVQPITTGDSRAYTCPAGVVATGRLDVRAALAVNDHHAQQVCKARTYLFEHMDAKAREVYRHAVEECSR